MGSVATLPVGFRDDKEWRRKVGLRELTGEDHRFLVEEAGQLLPAQWTTEVLRRCAIRPDTGMPLTDESVRSLTVGDREALLLQLRRLTSGDRLPCIVSCPSPECGEKLDLELRVTDLLVPACDARRESYEMELAQGERTCRVQFRLPTGLDQEAVAGLARSDLSAAVEMLLQRSLIFAEGATVSELPETARRQLTERMLELDPQAEINLRVTCQCCGGAFEVIFDAAGYFFQELKAEMGQLFHEVHVLAYHYHWSLKEILGMSAHGRRRYLRLLEEELGAGAES